MKFHTFNVNEDTWHAYLTEDDDDVISEPDSAAETDFDRREVFFRKGDLRLEDVRHECWHIFFGYTFVSTADLDSDQMEEVSAELFAERGERITKLAEELFTKLKSMRDTKEGNLDER